LLLFLAFGLTLEALHGCKAAIYLNVSNELRRLMWTLAHAHGAALALVHIALAIALSRAGGWPAPGRDIASACLTAATVLLPGGFFLAGLFLHDQRPGVGIVLVPIGGILFLYAALLAARAFHAKSGANKVK
jgi:hypothetical protein